MVKPRRDQHRSTSPPMSLEQRKCVRTLSTQPASASSRHSFDCSRFITVISGTWWVGTGAKFDPEATVSMPAGSFVMHFGKQVHYDGAKDGDTVLEIVGKGPATATPAEQK